MGALDVGEREDDAHGRGFNRLLLLRAKRCSARRTGHVDFEIIEFNLFGARFTGNADDAALGLRGSLRP